MCLCCSVQFSVNSVILIHYILKYTDNASKYSQVPYKYLKMHCNTSQCFVIMEKCLELPPVCTPNCLGDLPFHECIFKTTNCLMTSQTSHKWCKTVTSKVSIMTLLVMIADEYKRCTVA